LGFRGFGFGFFEGLELIVLFNKAYYVKSGFSLHVVRLKAVEGVFRFIPSVVAAFALVSLYAFSQVDTIVNGTLYSYSLQFSYDWANPYWDMAHLLVAMGWLIAGLAIALQVYLLVYKAPAAGGVAGLAREPEMREEDRWSTFKLGDGSTIKVKLVVKGAKRLNKFSEDGLPVYTVDTEPVVQVVDVPEELRASAR